MEKKKEGKIVEHLQFILIVVAVVGIILATIVCFWRIIVAPDWGQKLLAMSMLVPIWLGVFNMWKWFRSSSEFTEVSNKLDTLAKVMEEGITQTRDIEEQRRKDEREPPKIEVLNVESSPEFISLHVKNVGARGKVTATVKNHSNFKVERFKLGAGIKETVGEQEKELVRGEERRVLIRRRSVINTGRERFDLGLYNITLRFPETNQEFKYAFRITEEGIEDLVFLGEEDKEKV